MVSGSLRMFLSAPLNQNLRRGLTARLKRVVLKRFAPSERFPETEDLDGVDTLLAERVVRWQEGEAERLLRLLARRFGLLPEGGFARVRAASIAEIEIRGLNLLDAESLEAVFCNHHGLFPLAGFHPHWKRPGILRLQRQVTARRHSRNSFA